MDSMESNEEKMKLCLVCCSKVESREENDSPLCRNLLVIFVLKNVMQVPSEQLREHLRCNGNPVDWIRLCEECWDLSRQALDLHRQIVKIDRKLCQVQNLIVERTRSTSLAPSLTVLEAQQNDVWEKTRISVKICNFQSDSLPVNPFIEGDKLAKANYYLSQNLDVEDRTLANLPKIKIERVVSQSSEESLLPLALTAVVKAEPLNDESLNSEKGQIENFDGDDADWQTSEDRDDEHALVSETDELSRKKVKTTNRARATKTRKIAQKKMRIRINGKIKCSFCDKLFSQTTGCLKHENEHHPEIVAQFPCDICGRAWNSKEYLRQHIKTSHASSSVQGDDNDEMVENKLTMWKPKKMREKVNGKIKCYHCDKLFCSRQSCCRHERERHPEVKGQFPCEICGKAWNSRDYLNRHRKRRHKIILTGKDSVVTKLNRELIDKLKNTSRVKPFGCKFCDKTFRDRFGLGKHERSHANERRRKEKSERSTTTAKVKRRRGPIKLDWVDGKLKCGKCDKTFKHARSLRHHETAHTHKELLSSGENGTPEQTTNKRNFEWVDGKIKCGSCDKEFGSGNELLEHEREKHLCEEGEFICDLCGNVSTNLYKLTGHKKRVHKVNLDGSPWVQKTYKPRKDEKEEYGLALPNGKGKVGLSYLRVDGKLKCRSCDKLYARVDGMYRHEREKHPKKPAEYICTHCGMAFNSLEYLRTHTERKHWMKLDGTEKIPPWVPTRKYKWKKSEK